MKLQEQRVKKNTALFHMRKKLILLVDDDMDFLSVNRWLLEHKGYAVVTAGNGDECRACLETHRPDLIILDMMMTREDEGFDLSKDLRNSEHTRHIPIMMISAVNEYSHFTYKPDATWLPVDAFLEKPVDPRRLLQEVSHILTH